MQLRIFALSLLVLALNLKAQRTEVCRIEGKIENTQLRFDEQANKKRNLKLYLTTMDEYDRPVHIDSTEVKGGKFSFKRTLKPDEPRLLHFITGFDNGQIPVFVEEGQINIRLQEAAYPSAALVEGTPTNALYRRYKALEKRCSSVQIDSLKVFKEKHGEAWLDSPEGFEVRMRLGAAEIFECNANRIQFLLEHTDSPLTPLLMERELQPMFSKGYSELLLNCISPKLHNHPYYQSFYNTVKAQNLRVGGIVPNITLPMLDGTSKKLSDFRGKFILLDFWASWCAPCVKEIPHLKTIRQEAEAKGVEFVILSFSLDNKAADWKNAIVKHGISLPGWYHASDLLGWGSTAARLFSVTAIPKTILITPEGEAASFTLRGEEMVQNIRRVLNGDRYYEKQK